MEDVNTNFYTNIRIVHNMKHVPYKWIEVPIDIRGMIEAHTSHAFEDVSTYFFIFLFFLILYI